MGRQIQSRSLGALGRGSIFADRRRGGDVGETSFYNEDRGHRSREKYGSSTSSPKAEAQSRRISHSRTWDSGGAMLTCYMQELKKNENGIAV